MKFKLLFLVITTLASSNAWSAVSLQFGLAGQARATGFAGFQAASGTDGMRWGIIVDTLGNNFVADGYDAISVNSNGFVTVNGVASDDYYFANPSSTLTTTVASTSSGAEPGGSGAITTIGPLTITGITGLASGDAFAIIWFDGATAPGSHYGLFTNPAFTIPADGATQPYTSVFVGADAVKQANLTFAIPEPSRMMLLGFGVLGFFFRRRR